MAEPEILVVGAGPTGLSLALELRRFGVRPRIVDQNPTPQTNSRAVALHARTLEVLECMGLADRFLEVGFPVHGAAVYSGGRRILHFALDELDSRFRFALDLPQPATEQILEKALNDFGVEVERGVTATGFRQDESSISVFLQRPGGDLEQARYDFVAACDGAHSTIRHACSMQMENSAAFEVYIAADARLKWNAPEDEWLLFIVDEGVLSCAPLGGGWYRVIASLNVVPEPRPSGLKAALAAHGAELVELAAMASYHSQARRAASFRNGRVFLAGDAAHAFNPAGGQGLNTGIQDAQNLAWKLALAAQGLASPLLLDSYSAERSAVSQAIFGMTEQLASVAHLRGSVSNAVRDWTLSLLAGFDIIQQRLARQVAEVGINYRDSPIVSQTGRWHAGPAAGDRAMDAVLGDGTRLFDRFRDGRHAVLMCTGEHPSAGELRGFVNIDRYMREGYGANAHALLVGMRDLDWHGELVKDTASTVHHRYGASVPCVYIVRPDGYIGYRGQNSDPLPVLDYFGRIVEPVARPALGGSSPT